MMVCPHCDGTGWVPQGWFNGYARATECGFCDRGVKKRPDWMKQEDGDRYGVVTSESVDG